MDSGNSGSMQSSSGGDHEYDSSAATSYGLNSLSLPPPPSVSLSSSTTLQPTLFDPFSQSSYNLDLVWPNYQNTLPVQSPSPLLGPNPGPLTGSTDTSKPNPGPFTGPTDTSKPATGGPMKNSRKRTRASRRAPTTVLTTDTTNFRQMVQEFTGIPAPPFSAAATSSSPYARRLDLFPGGQFYPYRPSAQKANAAAPVTSNHIFPNPYHLANTSNLGYISGVQNQLLSGHNILVGSSKNQGGSLGEMGITQDHINANLSAFLNEEKGIQRINNGGGVEANNVISTRHEDRELNSWNYNQDLPS